MPAEVGLGEYRVEGVDTSTRFAPPARVPGWLWWLGLLFAVLTTAQSLGVCYMGSGWSAPRGTIGISQLAECGADRFCDVATVRPDSPAARSGILPGDRVRLDRYWERHRTLFPGERLGLTVRHGGHERHLDLVTVARSFYAPTWIVDGLASAAVCLIALLILVRVGRQRWSFLLGCSLVSAGIPGGYPRFWQNEPALFPWFFAALAGAYMAGPVLMLAALRGFRRETIGRAPRWLDRLILGTALTVAIVTLWGTAVELDSRPILGLSNGLLLTSLTWSVASLLGPLALAAGWRDVPPAGRTRYAFMWTAVSVSSIHPIIDPIIIATGNNYNDVTWPVVVQLASMILGTLLFAYAILRHRVVDLGFAVNRTIVYSALSFVTLSVFGLVEWASEKLLPLESHEASAVIEAGVALTLFLVFHHIHGWIERVVERLFFHRWHSNEATLRGFLHQAGYFTRPELLIERMVQELERFSGGAAVAFYRAVLDGYRLAAGVGQAETVYADAPAVVALRANRAVVRNGFSNGDLVLPMLHRGDLTGFVVLGLKPGGDPYRSDEEALLAEVAGHVALDLYALRVDELQADNARLSTQLETLAACLRPGPDRAT